MIKLNLGAGTSRYQDYLSVDFHQEADVTHDLTTKLPYEDGSVDAIYSSHVVEHFTRTEWESIRKDWARVLKQGGTLEIRCPDMIFVCRQYLEGDDEERALALTRIYGQQGDEGQLHKNGFDYLTLPKSFPYPAFDMKVLQGSTEYEVHMLFTKN